MNSESDGVQDQNFVSITFDKYIYKKIIDMIMDFVRLYGEQIPGKFGRPISWKLARRFQVILDFCRHCDDLPPYFKEPPLEMWNNSHTEGMIHIHPRLAMKFVMRLLNEIKRQQGAEVLTMAELDRQLSEAGAL